MPVAETDQAAAVGAEDLRVVREAQRFIRSSILLNGRFGITKSEPDCAPEVGVMCSFQGMAAAQAARSHRWAGWALVSAEMRGILCPPGA